MHWFWFHVTANEFFETDRFFLSVSPSPPTLLIKLSIASWLHANQLKTSCESLCLADQKVPCMMSRHQPSAFQVMPPMLGLYKHPRPRLENTRDTTNKYNVTELFARPARGPGC